jgi:transcriptional regulator with XRE-family HTH domain
MKTESARLHREREDIASPLGCQRRYLGMTRKELAERSGVSVKTISALEAGKKDVGGMYPSTAIKLCNALYLSLDAFLVLARSRI